MENKNTKKKKNLIPAITLGLVVLAGVGVASQIGKIADATENITMSQSGAGDIEWVNDLISRGYITQEEGDIRLAYYNASTEKGRKDAYEKLIDFYVSDGSLTQEQGSKAKSAGHRSDYLDDLFMDDDYEVTEEEYISMLVERGQITKEEGDLRLAYDGATTNESKKETYEKLVDFYVSNGQITQEQGVNAKSAGYGSEYLDDALYGDE